jgi:hypothetical protein
LYDPIAARIKKQLYIMSHMKDTHTHAHKLTFVALAAMAVTLSVAMLVSSVAAPAAAKITPVCKNPGGQEPQGNCQGQALTEENQNPAGKAPPGQNP